jgi:type VI secretion system protein
MNGTQSHGLFEVFTQEWLDSTTTDTVGGEEIYTRSIQDHLSRLLNARQGVLAHLPDYGLPDITKLYNDLPYTKGTVQSAIAHSIKKYEPRLNDVEIVSLPKDRDKAVLIFEIRASLNNGSKATFETHLLSEGTAKVVHRRDDKQRF